MGGKCQHHAFLRHLGVVPPDDFHARFRWMARAQSGADVAGSSELRSPDLDRACGFEAAVDPMKLLITGLSHHTAPVEVRERLAFEENTLLDALYRLRRRPGMIEGMILSTCNRVEVAVTAEEQ